MNEHIDLTQDSVYDLTINKDRDLNLQIQSEVWSGSSFIGLFDFTPYTGATLQIRVKPNDSNLVLSFSVADNSIVFGVGEFALVKSADQLANVRSGEFFYDMFLSSTTQKRRAFLSGRITINSTVSR